MIIFIILAIFFGMLSIIFYRLEHNTMRDGCCDGVISGFYIGDTGGITYYVKAIIDGREREGESCTYAKGPLNDCVGQEVKIEYCFGKKDYLEVYILEEGFIKRSFKGAYIIFGILSIVSLIAFVIAFIFL